MFIDRNGARNKGGLMTGGERDCESDGSESALHGITDGEGHCESEGRDSTLLEITVGEGQCESEGSDSTLLGITVGEGNIDSEDSDSALLGITVGEEFTSKGSDLALTGSTAHLVDLPCSTVGSHATSVGQGIF
jgi:hypothetical protein